MDSPRFRFEGTGSVTEPIRDQWPGSNTDYYAVQHWAHVGNEDWGVTWTPLDTPMAEFGGLWPGYVSGAHHGVRGPGYGHAFLRSGELRQGYMYAMISYNNFRTNFVNVHPGEYVVRYAFSSHRGDWRTGRAWQFGWNATNPPLAVWDTGIIRQAGEGNSLFVDKTLVEALSLIVVFFFPTGRWVGLDAYIWPAIRMRLVNSSPEEEVRAARIHEVIAAGVQQDSQRLLESKS